MVETFAGLNFFLCLFPCNRTFEVHSRNINQKYRKLAKTRMKIRQLSQNSFPPARSLILTQDVFYMYREK